MGAMVAFICPMVLISEGLSHFVILFQVSEQFFPHVSIGYKDPRVTLHIGDGRISPFYSLLLNLFIISALNSCLHKFLLSLCRSCFFESSS